GLEWQLAKSSPDAWRWLPGVLIAQGAGEKCRESQRALLARLNAFLSEAAGERWESAESRWLAFLMWNLAHSPRTNRVTTVQQWMHRLHPILPEQWRLSRGGMRMVTRSLLAMQPGRPPP